MRIVGFIIADIGFLGVVFYALARPLLISLSGASAIQLTQYYTDGTFHVAICIGLMLFGGILILDSQSDSDASKDAGAG